MVDYKAIADEAESYGDYQTAFDVMSLETTEEFKELSSNNLREWCVSNSDDYALLKSDGTTLSELALKQINIDASPLDMRKESIRGFVSVLPISDTGKKALTDAATIEIKVWQGLKPGHVQNALQKRAEGKI